MEDSFHLGVKALIFNKEGKLLLLKLNPKKYKSAQKDRWDIPGGRMKKNESLEETLKREVYEETGLQDLSIISPFAMALTNIRIPVQNGDVGLIFATYLCELNEDRPICLSEEHDHFQWLEPEKVAELLSVNYPIILTEKISKLRKHASIVD